MSFIYKIGMESNQPAGRLGIDWPERGTSGNSWDESQEKGWKKGCLNLCLSYKLRLHTFFPRSFYFTGLDKAASHLPMSRIG